MKLTKKEVANKYVSKLIDIHELPLNEPQIDLWATEIARYLKPVVDRAWLEIMSSIKPKFVPSLRELLNILDKYEISMMSEIRNKEKKKEKQELEDVLKNEGGKNTDWQDFIKSIMVGYGKMARANEGEKGGAKYEFYLSQSEFFSGIGRKADSDYMLKLANECKPKNVVPMPTLPPIEIVE